MQGLYSLLRYASGAGAWLALAFLAFPAYAGNLWLTGHDADFHCSGGSQCNHMGVAANFVRQGAPTKARVTCQFDAGGQVVAALGDAQSDRIGGLRRTRRPGLTLP